LRDKPVSRQRGVCCSASRRRRSRCFSARAKEFISENVEILAAIDQLRAHSGGRGIWAIDRGGDRKKLLEPLLERGARFVIRSVG